MRWAQVKVETWTDPAFTELSADARLLFLWSWTGPLASISGLYPCSPRQMGRALGDGAEVAPRVDAALQALGAKPLVQYDPDGEVLWVVNRAKHANRSPKTAVAMKREWERCPASLLKDAFRRKYAKQLDL